MTKRKPSGPKRPNHKEDRPEPERWRLFVEAYMGECLDNQGAAARAAGYGTPTSSAKSLSEIGRRLLATPEVQAMLAERRAACPKAATREELQERWTAIARGEPVVTKVKGQKPRRVYPNMKEMLAAMRDLGKSLGLFVAKHEVKHGGEVVFRAELPSNGRDDGTS